MDLNAAINDRCQLLYGVEVFYSNCVLILLSFQDMASGTDNGGRTDVAKQRIRRASNKKSNCWNLEKIAKKTF